MPNTWGDSFCKFAGQAEALEVSFAITAGKLLFVKRFRLVCSLFSGLVTFHDVLRTIVVSCDFVALYVSGRDLLFLHYALRLTLTGIPLYLVTLLQGFRHKALPLDSSTAEQALREGTEFQYCPRGHHRESQGELVGARRLRLSSSGA